MIVATFFVLFALLYCVADVKLQRQTCARPCRNCPYWNQCLSRRICSRNPDQDPELCLLHWN